MRRLCEFKFQPSLDNKINEFGRLSDEIDRIMNKLSDLSSKYKVIENELRMATARCLVDSEIISITKDEFDKRVNNSDVFVKGCLKALSYRLRSVEKKM